MNPVIMLDEVDKVGADWRGDPSAALLEVLDPAQNHSFRDHYLDVELDLSGVLFIATANIAETIPAPLLDRMEVVRFDGYTTDEKVAIAARLPVAAPARAQRAARRRGRDRRRGDPHRDHRVHPRGGRPEPRARARQGAAQDRDRGRLRSTRRARFRSTSTRSARRSDASGSSRRRPSGRPCPGVATGLSVTGAGGDVLFIEATAMPGKDGLVLTGQLGDVMKESARIALSYVRSRAEELGIDEDAFADRQFHVHVPAGAIPKDGPSAGITMTTAFASLLSGRPGPPRRRDDRRDHAPGPGAADRRPEAEGPGRARRRPVGGDPPGAQPRRPGGRPRGRARADALPPRDDDRRGARARPRAGTG